MTSQIKVNQITPSVGTDVTIGESGGTVTLAEGALPIGWEKAGYTAAYSVSAWVPDGSNSTPDYNNIPIAETSGTHAGGIEAVVNQTPIGISIVETGNTITNKIKILHSGVYVIYTAVMARTSASNISLNLLECSAVINGERVRDGASTHAPERFGMYNVANNVAWTYAAATNDTWIGLLSENDEIQFWFDASSSSGSIRIPGLVGSIIYVGDSD